MTARKLLNFTVRLAVYPSGALACTPPKEPHFVLVDVPSYRRPMKVCWEGPDSREYNNARWPVFVFRSPFSSH